MNGRVALVYIREYEPTDYLSVRQLFVSGQLDFAIGEIFESEVRSYIQKSLDLDLKDITSHYKTHDSSNFWIAEVSGEIKGTVAIQHHNKESAELRRMSVSRDARRKGIGTLLLNTVDQFCKVHGYDHIFLSTVSHLVPAIRMYKSNGYQKTHTQSYGLLTVEHYIKYI
ncbi:MAG: hypothetical protein CL886_04555 [Dehalococcoidia bacterium]|nr:hypothetical protein [Dehalococcoidia bacterium]